MKLTISQKTYLINEVVAISFREKPWVHQAGQFLTIRFNKNNELVRSYSIVSLPDQPYTIWVKRIPNGEVSNWLYHEANVGDLIEVEEPKGRFCLDKDQLLDTLVLCGAGSGVAPLMPILHEALYYTNIKQVIWLESASSFSKSLSISTLAHYKKQYGDRLKLHFFITQADDLTVLGYDVNADAGYLSNIRFENWLKEQRLVPSCSQFFLCGPEPLMRLQRFELKLNGWPDEQIKQEQFVIKPKRVPSDLNYTQQQGMIEWNGHITTVQIEPNETLLAAGLKAGLPLPFSCKSGQCSACIARLTEGEVDHLTNEVLTTRDLQNGYILPCQARPKTGVTWIY